MDFIFNKGLAMLLTMGAVFLFSLLILSILNRAFEHYQQLYVAKASRALSEMFLFVDGRQLLMLNVCVTGIFVLFGLIFFNIFFTIVLAIVGFFVPSILVKQIRRRRVNKFNHQLVDSLNTISNALKAGLTFAQAMEHVAAEAEAPLSQEFGLFVREIKLGVPFDDALDNMAQRVGCDDLKLVATCTAISRKLGGNMAEMFDTIASTIRERFRLEGKIRALTAQGRLQGWIVAALPFVLGLIINYMRPDLMGPMMEHWFGYLVIGLIVLMETLGILLIRKIVNIDV